MHPKDIPCWENWLLQGLRDSPTPLPEGKPAGSLHVVPDGVRADDNTALTLLQLLGCLHSHRHGTARAATCQDTQQGRTIKPRGGGQQKRGGERTEEPRGRKMSSEVEGGLCDLHKASAPHRTTQRKAEGPSCSYHTAAPPRGSSSGPRQRTPHHCSCTTGPLPGEGQETETRLWLNQEGQGSCTTSVNSAPAL